MKLRSYSGFRPYPIRLAFSCIIRAHSFRIYSFPCPLTIVKITYPELTADDADAGTGTIGDAFVVD